MWSKWKCVKKLSLYYRGECRVNMGFSKNDFEKVDLRIKKITEQTVEQIEIDSELPPTIEQLEDNNRTYSIMAAMT